MRDDPGRRIAVTHLDAFLGAGEDQGPFSTGVGHLRDAVDTKRAGDAQFKVGEGGGNDEAAVCDEEDVVPLASQADPFAEKGGDGLEGGVLRELNAVIDRSIRYVAQGHAEPK